MSSACQRAVGARCCSSVSRSSYGGRREVTQVRKVNRRHYLKGLLGGSFVGSFYGAPFAFASPPTATEISSEADELRVASSMFASALDAPDVREEERLWTEILDRYGCNSTPTGWRADACARAVGNRGNARSRQGKLEAALQDFEQSINLAPESNDPRVNRGATLEALGRFDEAASDYLFVLERDPNDPVAHNNLGNARLAMGEYEQARASYHKASTLAPQFSFAANNEAIASFQLGDDTFAFRSWRSLLRKYPGFDDARAALAAALWATGEAAKAEDELARVDDMRYRDKAWREKYRRWPPRLESAMVAMLELRFS